MGEMLLRYTGIYNAESYNSQQNESFYINWLICMFYIIVNIPFNANIDCMNLYSWKPFVISNANVICMHVPFTLSFFFHKYLSIQKLWKNNECSIGRSEMQAVWCGRYNFKRQLSIMLPFKHEKLLLNIHRLIFNELYCPFIFFKTRKDCPFPDWVCQLFPCPGIQLWTLSRCLEEKNLHI